MKKVWDLKKVLSYPELEGQGRGIIIKVTRPLLLGPFYLSTQTFWPPVYVKYILISLKNSLYLLKKIPPKKKFVAAVHSVSSRQIELLDLVYCLGGFKRDGSRLKRVLKFGENNRIWDFKIGRLFFIHRYTARGTLHVQ